MDSLITLTFLRFIFLLSLFHSYKEEEIINNPIMVSDHQNPLVLAYNDKYIILTSGQRVIVNKETGIIESSNNFCEYSSPYVLGSTESGQKFIYSSKKFCVITLPNGYTTLSYNSMTFSDNSNYIGYIQESIYSGNPNKYQNCRCEMKDDEIIIYGKSGTKKLIFTYVYKLKLFKEIEIDKTFTNIEDKIICKKLLNSFYSCAVIGDGQIYLFILIYKASSAGTTTNCELFKRLRVKLSRFFQHTEVEIYPTDINTKDILCAKNINTKIIECSEVNYKINEIISNSQCNYTITVTTKVTFSYPPTDNNDENNADCDYKSFGNEYLFCCGGINYIKCQRLDIDGSSLYSFNLDLQGMNKNINILSSSSSFVTIFYLNENPNQNIYEYIIYIPTCVNKQYTIIAFHNINEGKSEENKETINEFFTRTTNTKYYIKFENIPTEYGDLSINSEIITENSGKILIEENNDNILDFFSTNENGVDNFEITYKIILDETYSSECKIDLTILPCYRSCSRCTKDSSSSNPDDHNCIENKCREDYYKDPTKNTNCFKISEKKTNWYFDNIEMKFGICNILCVSCNGPLDNNCITCYSIDDDPNHAFLYNNQCIDSCPEGTYETMEPEGFYRCNPCHKNCKECSSLGNDDDMKCDSCYENNIYKINLNGLKNCFRENNSNSKKFYLPNEEISSCYEKYNYYIEENTYQCVEEMPENEYFVSNTQTGLFSKCHEDCKKCSKIYIDNNSNCDVCKNEDYYNLYGNCIENCPESGHYIEEIDNQKMCYKCHDNCLSCELGPELNLGINMNCNECKKGKDSSNNLIENYIQVDKNCFPIKIYNNEKITFDVSIIDSEENIKSCLDYSKAIFYGEYKCVNKPLNTYYVLNNGQNTGIIKYCDEACTTCNGQKNDITQDTNCILCKDGYFKTEDSETNCILESLIPENYYKNNNIYYHCYINCKKCDNSFDSINNEMNCISCIENYYFVYGTKNCYDIHYIDNNNYYLSTDNQFHRCYNSCKKCSTEGLDEKHQNCDECISDYYFEFETKNCYNILYTEQGYYLDIDALNEELSTFKKCHQNCKTCKGAFTDNNMNCDLCLTNYYKIFRTDNCYNEDLINQGYFLKDGFFYPCEENCLTCSDNKEIKENNIIINNCISCDKEKGLYLVNELKNCEPIDYKSLGYYLKKENNDIEIFYKCYRACELCEKGLESDINNKEIHNCEKCVENTYKLKDDCENCEEYNNLYNVNPNNKNCYGNEMISYGYHLRNNYWTICYINCETCSGKPVYDENNNIINQNCVRCIEGLHLIYNTGNCETDSILENGYYFDDNDLKYHKCDIQCKTCEKYSTQSDPKCLLCNELQEYYHADNKPISHCYNRNTIDPEYTLIHAVDSNTGLIYKKWLICYSTCLMCFSTGDSLEHNCLSCKSRHYLIYNSTNCITNEYASENGYYFNLTYNRYVKCDKACINCNDGPKEGNTNCIKCNEENGYYQINGKSSSSCYNNNTIGEGYYLDKLEEPNKWSPCYEYCATCDFRGTKSHMLCNSCKKNIIDEITKKPTYFKLSNGNCIKSCPENLYLTYGGDCVEVCPNATYGYDPNTSCVDTCPVNYQISSDRKKCELAKLDDDATPSQFKDMITNNLTLYVDSKRVINGSNFKAQIISSSDLDPIEQIKNGISGLDLGNCITILKKHYNIPKEEDLIIVEIETKEDKEKNKNLNKKVDFVNLGKNVQASIYDKSNRKLDMSYCNDITIMKNLADLEGVDFETAKKMAEQNIDVFNVNDTFFNDICHPFKSESGDIIIKDRRDDLFQNVTFCGEGCLYNGIDYNYMIARCICDGDNIQTGEDNNLGLNDERKGVSLNDIVNSFTGQLFNFNFKVVTCYNLIFDSDILKRNIGFKVMISLIGVELFIFLFFSKNRLKPIKNYMLVFEPFDPNIDPPNPPKKNKISYILNSENDKIANIDKENKNNDEKENNLNEKEKEIETQKSRKSILFNNLILKKKPVKKNSNFHEFLNQSKFNSKERYNNHENDDALIVKYLSNENSSDNSNNVNADNSINDSSDINKTESYIDYDIDGKDKKKLGISVHKMRKKNVKDRYDDLNDINYKNNTLSLEQNKSRRNQRNLFQNQLNKSIKFNSPDKKHSNLLFNSPDKKHSNLLYSVSPKKRKVSFNEPTVQYSNKSMIRSLHNHNKTLNLNQMITLDNEDEIDIDMEENKDKDKDIVKDKENKETIIPVDVDFKVHNSKKKYMKNVKNKLKLDNISQMVSTEVLISNDDKKLKNIVKKIKDKEIYSSKPLNRRKKSSNSNAMLNNLSTKRESNLDENENKGKNKNNLGNMKLKDKKVNYAYTDEELQDMEFEEALHNDNRPFIRIYWSYLIEEHIIINNVFSDSYLDLRIIKISFLFFSLIISFFLNSFFYTDDYISESYHNNGVLDFVSSLPKAIYSFLVTIIISNLLKMLSTNKKNLKEIINEKLSKMEYLKRMESALKQLRIKLIIYFICLFTFGILFLYYITAFCAVYQNSQYYWLYGCLESFFLDMLTPFFICILLACFRYIGLIKHSSFFYSLAFFLSNIL